MAKEPEPKPRCHTCRWWNRANEPGTWGICQEPTGRVYVDEAIHRHVEKLRLTTDMMACSLWAARD